MRLLISSLLLLVPSIALAAPGIPESFHGSVTGSVGTSISALIEGVAVASTTIESGGVYGYAPHLFLIPDAAGDRTGKAVTFRIGSAPATQTVLFANGAIATLDLSLPGTTPATTATSTNAAGSSTASSGSLIKGAVLPSKRVPMPLYYQDLTGDRKTDIYDFSYLLGHWGLAGQGTTADINKDGIVNLLDFNILMGHWAL